MERILDEDTVRVFEEHPLYSQDGLGDGAKVLACFTDSTCTAFWLITEASRLPDGDWEMFGYCDLGFPEYGYVRLSQMYGSGLGVMPISDVEPCRHTVGELREILGI